MKKSNLFFMMAAGAMLATSCASEQEIPEVPGSNDAGKQLIYLSVANDNGNTRAGRPLTDGAAAQDIENVKLILVKGETVVWTKDIKDWNNGGSEAYSNGRQAVVEIPKGDGDDQYTLSPNDNCTLYAIGYSNGTGYGELEKTVAAYKKHDKFDKNITLTYGGAGFAEEIFAGEKTGLKGGDNGLKADLVLNRQVAGTYGYMNEIPYVENDGNVARYLTLVASDQNATIALGQFDNTDHENGKKNDKFVVNTLPGAGETVIYTIDLKDWFGELEEDENIPGQISTKNWKNTTKGTNAPSYVKPGAVFAGAFIHPFKSVNGTNTFKLYLSATEDYKQDSNAMSWNVTLPNGPQLNENGYNFSSLGANGFSAFANYSRDTKYVYNVLRNHLYSIGVKPTTKPVDPNNPDPDPDPEPGEGDDDDPTPLNNKQEITLKVNSCWEVIHNMGLE